MSALISVSVGAALTRIGNESSTWMNRVVALHFQTKNIDVEAFGRLDVRHIRERESELWLIRHSIDPPVMPNGCVVPMF
jgi:hypothetical protein